MKSITVLAVTNLPEIQPGDDLASMLIDSDPPLCEGDILIVTQKVVSKSEGRLVPLAEVVPSEDARSIAQRWDKDPHLVELVLRESKEILREERGVLISRTHQGFVCANAGIDLSNVDGGNTACLLPFDCDASARSLSRKISRKLGFSIPVIISDSFGRPWRLGITNIALGSYGLKPLLDHRGKDDGHGLEMKATVIALADTIAASTELVVGKTYGYGAAILRGYRYEADENLGVCDTIRPWDQCFFV